MPGSAIFQALPSELPGTQTLNHASPTQQLPIQTAVSPHISLYPTRAKRADSASQAVLIAWDETLVPSSDLSDAWGNTICGFWQDYENKGRRVLGSIAGI